MNKLIASLFLLASFNAFAQKTDADYSPVQYKSTTCRSSYTKIRLDGENNAGNVQKLLKKGIDNLKDYRTGLKLNYVKESPGGFHYSFTQTYLGIEIYHTEIKVNTDRQGVVHSLFDNSENTSLWNLLISGNESNRIIAHRAGSEQPVLCTRMVTGNSREVLELNGEVIFEQDMNSYFAHDSMVSGNVFLPDPLTSAFRHYGPPYYDAHDSTNAELDAELKPVTFMATFDDSIFLLKNSFVQVADFDNPSIAPATSVNGHFDFNRSQSGFEDVSAFYHITTMGSHIQSLGFDCANPTVVIDAHAVSGADNSYFSPNEVPNHIYYGTGGVDDAEDADVCVHEYGHFISNQASPGSNSGTERQSLDEGFGDYLAGSYSKNLSTNQDDWVFNWDGHNPFWNGRVLNSLWIYPDDITTSIYHNGQIWSAVLWCINESIGRDATDSVILQAHYAYAQDILMQDAAQLLLDADTLLTGGRYACPIYNCLLRHGLNPQNPFFNCTVGINDEQNFPIRFVDQGSYFSLMNPNTEKMHLEIFDVQGKLLSATDESQATFNYSNLNLCAGIYFVNVQVNGLMKTFKWVKL